MLLSKEKARDFHLGAFQIETSTIEVEKTLINLILFI